jgi:hypothetical protein
MEVFINAAPGFGRPRDEVEDAIEEFLGQRGVVTGGGAGELGANIDIEIHGDDIDSGMLVEGLRALLISLSVPANTEIVFNGKSYSVA